MVPALLLVEVVFVLGVAVGVGVGLGLGVTVGLGVDVGVAGGGWTVTCVVAWEVTYPVFIAVALIVQVVACVKLVAVKDVL
jgi:hypothetical protein